MLQKYEQVFTRCYHLVKGSQNSLRTTAFLVLGLWFLGSSSVAQPVSDLDAFFRAVTDGRAEKVQADLGRHPEWVNAELFLGIRPLYRAAVLGRAEVVAVLMQAGADLNATTDQQSYPLHAAARHGYLDILRGLLAGGATVNVENSEGQTPLHLAARFKQTKAVEVLLAYGADPNLRDQNGRAPLHYAAGLGQIESLNLLLDGGANYDVLDSEGFSPLGLSISWRRNAFLEVQEKLGNLGAVDAQPDWARKQEEAEVPADGARP